MAHAWSEFARLMETTGAATVADLDRTPCPSAREKLWVVPPGGSLL